MVQSDAAPGRSGVLSVEGCSLAWTEAGDGTPVLFSHGTGASAWGDLFDRAARVGRAIRYDRRGFGVSKSVPIASLSRHAEDAAAILQGLNARDAVVVGWSIGGVIAAELAVKHGELLRGLILLEPPLWAKKHPDFNLFWGVVLSIALGYVAGPRKGGMRFIRWVFRERDGGNSLDRADRALRARLEANAAAIGVEIRAGTGEHLSPEMLADIRLPTVVLAGDRGHPFFAAAAERAARAIPGARLQVLPGGSHMLQIERAEEIAAVAEELIRGA